MDISFLRFLNHDKKTMNTLIINGVQYYMTNKDIVDLITKIYNDRSDLFEDLNIESKVSVDLNYEIVGLQRDLHKAEEKLNSLGISLYD